MPTILRLHECLGRGTELQPRAAWRSDCLRCCKCDRILRVKRLNQIFKLPRDVLNTAKSPATRSHLLFGSALQPVKQVNLKKDASEAEEEEGGRRIDPPSVRGRASNINVRAFQHLVSAPVLPVNIVIPLHGAEREEIRLKRPT